MTIQLRDPAHRSAVYELLSLAFLYPEEGAARQLLDGARELRDATENGSPIGRHIDELCGVLQPGDDARLEDEYIQLFGHTVSADCSPYESEYGQAHIFQKSHTLADLSTFYGAFGVSLNPDLKDRLDHLSVEMEFMHLLTLKEAIARIKDHGDDKVLVCRQAQEAFLANHLATWVMDFTKRLVGKTGCGGSYAAVAGLLEAHMDAEFRTFHLEPESPGSAEPHESREDDLDCNPFAADTAGRQEVGAP
jgi:DMSO reductase family type II enzyme chaperone